MIHEPIIHKKITCFHCGDDCQDNTIHLAEKTFCCEGCKMVYEIINQNGLCEYYDIDKNPGITQKVKVREGKFAFLDDQTIQDKLIHFTDGRQNHVTFYLPQMHCSSCIWLLEHLGKIQKGVIRSQVNFLKKEVTVVYEQEQVSLRKIAEILTAIGYEPYISLNDVSTKKIKKHNRSRIFKIGVAGFAFGNIMMLSFPEYFSFGHTEDKDILKLFSYLNLGLSLPVFFYSASEFFVSAWKGLTQKFLNIDAPIALAIIITFSRSVYEILGNHGAGYLDSMSGIVFFMLLGRFFQDRTYDSLSFDRDFKSYFPLGVSVLNEDGTEKQVSVNDLKVGQRIKIHSDEIVPADAMLFLGKAQIDYSFVTGESLPVEKTIGEIIYAGGKQIGGSIELEVIKDVSQSYLTQLWNNDVFKEEQEEKKVSFVHALSKNFTYALFVLAIATFVYWQIHEPTRAWNAVTAILIVACPCALLLSFTFTNGNMLRFLSKYKFYVKNANVVERIAESDTIVFDKTGTITQQQEAKIVYQGIDLSEEQQQWVRSLANQSNHPLSQAISSFLPFQKNLQVKNFIEFKGKGLKGEVNGHELLLGSADFVTHQKVPRMSDGSKVYVSIDQNVLGSFVVKNKYREGLEEVIKQLSGKYKMAILSGDNDSEKEKLSGIFGTATEMRFNQKPEDKLNYIKALQSDGHKVIMIGDGLNDAGALKQSYVGVVITDNINNFSPASDAILAGSRFEWLAQLFSYCGKEKSIIVGSFIVSVLYNLVGLYYSVNGELEPVIAAILMPISSFSILIYTTGLSSFYAYKKLKHAFKSKIVLENEVIVR